MSLEISLKEERITAQEREKSKLCTAALEKELDELRRELSQTQVSAS
jgi:hypothetical protein